VNSLSTLKLVDEKKFDLLSQSALINKKARKNPGSFLKSVVIFES